MTPQPRISFGNSEDSGQQGNQPGQGGRRSNTNASFSSELQHDVPAHLLRSLRRGGPSNGYKVDIVVGVSGRTWSSTDRPSIVVEFDQIRL